MESSYSSVAQFYLDLRAFFLREGMTVERTLGPTDIILNAGDSMYLRLQKVSTLPEVIAIGMACGNDPDDLAVRGIDSERFMPFEVKDGASFDPGFCWQAEEKYIGFTVGDGVTHKMYKIIVSLNKLYISVVHQDRYHEEFQPNFKETGGPYIQAGA